MHPPSIEEARDLRAATEAAWRSLVEKTLKGAALETLDSAGQDGLVLHPLYAAGEPGERLRLGPLAASDSSAWDIRVDIRWPDPAGARDLLLAGLAAGAASGILRIDPTGATGVVLSGPEALAAVLDGVMLDLAPVALDAGFLGPPAAEWLSAAAKASPNAPLAAHLDPLSAFAVTGFSPGPIEAHVLAAAHTAARLAPVHPRASLFLASGRCVHEAGGGPAAELAFAIAAALTYAKAMTQAGMTAPEAFGGIVLGLAIDADPLVTIAKLRAARRLWARLSSACEAPSAASIEARSSARMLTRADPWSNLARLTAAGFAGAVGAADAIQLGAFTDAIGAPTPSARRIARNTQLILMQEGRLGAVRDPAAGSGAFETLTDDIARAAWVRFNRIEQAGGLVGALRDGAPQRDAAASRHALAEGLASQRIRVLGVTDFRHPEVRPASVETPPPVGLASAPDPRLPGPDSHCLPLTPVRLEELAP